MEQTKSNSINNNLNIRYKHLIVTLISLLVLFLFKNLLLDITLFLFSSIAIILILSIVLIITVKSVKWLFCALLGGLSIYAVFSLLIILTSI